MEIKLIHIIIGMILAIGVLASFSGIIPEPTGALSSNFFKVGLRVDDSITNETYEVLADSNTTALKLLDQKYHLETTESEEVNAIFTSSWIMDNNESHWVFLVNGKRPTLGGVSISEGRYYVSPDDEIAFIYTSRNT